MEPIRERRETPSLTSLIKDLRDESLLLIRQEVALARKEITQKVKEAGQQGAQLGAGGAVAYAGALFLLYAVSQGLFFGMIYLGAGLALASVLAPLIVGGIAAGVGWTLIQKARQKLNVVSLVPDRTIRTLKEDTEWAARKVR